MNCESASSAGRKSSYDALTSLLGVEGALRLLPQGSTPKAHIVLKRDYPKGEGKSDQTSTVARFSFIAGKKFTINKGQPLLFAVACPTDRDGKTLLGDDNTFVLEADIKGNSEDSILEDTGRLPEQEDSKRSENIECLPPKARKSLVRKKAYASYIENEPPLSSGFPGYSLEPTTPRVYSTASVQTDLFSVSEPTSLTPTLTPSSLPATSLLVDAEKSPFQLPSPVSAKHAQESNSDALGQTEGEETDASSRAERSLSPMDLSSADSTPNTSPVPAIIELPKEGSSQTLEDEDSPATPVASSSPEELVPASLTSPVLATTVPDSTATARASQTLDGCLDEDVVLKAENSAASRTNEPIKELKETIPSGPRAMQVPRPSMQPSSRRFIEMSPVIPAGRLALPTPIPNWQSGAVLKVNEGLNDSQPPEPKALAYISAGSTSNPLGIRPSSALTSSTHVPPKSVPTGPRSLTASMAPKKPVIVGSQWSAVRGSSSGSQTSNGNFSTTSNSSSLTTLPPSPVIPPIHKPPPFVRATLSQILPYASPSPPPPPESSPPPPPPPLGLYEPIPNKWKRISNIGDSSKPGMTLKSPDTAPGSNGNPSNTKNDLKTAASPNILETSLKRHHDEIKEPVGPSQQSDASQEQPSKKARTTPQKDLTSASATLPIFAVKREVSTSSAAIPKATTNVVTQKLPTPRTHPLPPKPTTTGSSYRPPPPKRERSPEPPEPKRPSPRTDWPPTFPSAEARLQNSVPGADISVQKIIFNTDGSQIALICGDQTLRIWENKLAAAEIARLTHNSSITSACWIGGNIGVMTLCADGMISTWTRNGKEWKFAKLFRVHDGGAGSSSADTPLCLAYEKDRIAVSMPSGVKVWIFISGTWQQQREIARSAVTVIKFVQDGNALIGGCRDGVLWYCEVPNGTLRVHTFLPKTAVTSIDVHPSGVYLLVGQEGGKANLITLKTNECKGSVERTYTSAKLQSMTTLGFPAVFATNGQAVLYGTVNGCALVWDRKKGAIVYGLKHPEDDPILSAATFDGRPGGVDGWMITGTKKGRLFWWPRPVAAAPTSHGANGHGTAS